jgi:thioester reductase-like protein
MLRILDREESTDPALFNKLIDEDNISLVKITPSHLLALVGDVQPKYKSPIKNIVLGGEKLSWETVKTILSLGICSNLFNHYGPTETTIGAIACKIEWSSPHFDVTGSVPLGSALGEGRLFLQAGAGDVGELCITGPGVSIGYFDNDIENEKKFFYRQIDGEPQWCYRTGDICKALPDGNYEFLYRTDRQVKLRGYRVELGEIELALIAHPDIENVAVCMSDHRRDPVMNAYIKPVGGRVLNAAALRSWMQERMPSYKIPSNFFLYSKTPYNSNGKVDMTALKKMFSSEINPADYEAEIDTLSWAELVEWTWKKMLNKETVSPSDNFFETGGDSLLAIQLIGKLQRCGFAVHIADLNNHPVMSALIALAPARASVDTKTPVAGTLQHVFTFPQQSFLLRNEFNPDAYCQSILLETDNKIRVREMAIALNCLLKSHDQLEMAYRKKGSSYVKEKRPFHGTWLRTSVMDAAKPLTTQIQETSTGLLQEISLAKGSLFVAHVMVDPMGKDYLFIACHHLATDVISWHIIINDLLEFYEQALHNGLPAIISENIVDQFLHEISPATDFTDPVPFTPVKIYRLPEPGPAPVSNVNTVLVNQVVLPTEIAVALKEYDRGKRPGQLPGLLLSAIATAMLTVHAMQKISIDLEFHGRPQQQNFPDLSRSVGWWATTLPANIDLEHAGPAACTRLLEEKALVANRLNAMYDRAAYLSAERPGIRFNYLGQFPAVFGNESSKMKPSAFNPGSTRSQEAHEEYKFCFTARFIGDQLIVDMQYQSRYFNNEALQRVNSLFLHELGKGIQPIFVNANSGRSLSTGSNMPTLGQPLYNVDQHIVLGSSPARNILLTGATGFLGIHLAEILTSTDACRIYCIVRGENQRHAERRLENEYQYFFGELPAAARNRIQVIKGDITQEDLGLSPVQLAGLADTIDQVIHTAANVNLLKDYEELRQTNIHPIRSLIALAETGRQKEIHYISTLAVSGYIPGGGHRYFSEDDFDNGQAFVSDYERTKFEAEQMVRQFFKKGGAGSIYRVGHIAADSIHGRFQRNIDQNRIFQVIQGILLLKMIPDTYTESLSFSYVDIVAAAIANSCQDNSMQRPQCLHVDNPQYISFTRVAEMLQQSGFDIEVVDMDIFKQAVARFEGRMNDKKTIDLAAVWIQRAIDFPRKVTYAHRKSIDRMALQGLHFPALSHRWLLRMMKDGIRAGYFQLQPSTELPSTRIPVLENI